MLYAGMDLRLEHSSGNDASLKTTTDEHQKRRKQEARRRAAVAAEEKRRFAEAEEDCPECERRRRIEAKFSESEIRRARIEMIKNRILTNLRLPHRPNVTSSRSTIPPQLLKVLEFDDYSKRKRARKDDDDEAPKATQVFIFGEGKRDERACLNVFCACLCVFVCLCVSV